MSTGAMGMSAKLVLGLIVVIALGNNQSFAAPQPNSESSSYSEIQFTRCDNSTEPLGKIEISACKDKKEFCIFREGSYVTAEIEFTPERTHESSIIGMDFGKSAVGVDVCKSEGAKCPFEAGVKQHIKAEIHIVMVWQEENKAKLILTDDSYLAEPYWYCIEMPARLV